MLKQVCAIVAKNNNGRFNQENTIILVFLYINIFNGSIF